MHRLGICLSLAAAGLCFLAADWPQYRGSDRSNVSPDKGLLKEWPKDGPRLVWKAFGVGTGFASVSVFGDRVYTMGNKDGSACIFAIDRAKGGEPLWQAKIGKPGTGGRGGNSYPGPRCTPATDGEYVIGLGPKGDLACVEAAKGNSVWKKDLMSEYGGKHGTWEYSESPLIDGDRVVCVPGGTKATMVVFDKKKGTEVWKAPLGDSAAGYSSVVISNACGKKQYVVLTASGTIGVDAATGKELCYKKFSGNTANIPTPIAVGDQIFTVSGYRMGAALLTLSKKGDGIEMKEEYFAADMKTKHGGVVIVGDYAYGDAADQGTIMCMEWKTGNVKWKKARGGKGSGSASLTAADGMLFIHYANGYVALAAASPDGYKETGSFKIPNASERTSWAHPVVIDGKLYVRDASNVFCYDVKGK